MPQDLFYVPIFFIIFRETTEASIIVSVLLSFLRRIFEPSDPIYKRLRKQVWLGTIIGFVICLCIGAAFIAVWYTVLNNLWGATEYIWEAVFCFIAAILITAMGLAMLKTERMQEEWKLKLAKSIMNKEKKKQGLSAKFQRYSFFLLPFITVLREGLEAVVFIGGVSNNKLSLSLSFSKSSQQDCLYFVDFSQRSSQVDPDRCDYGIHLRMLDRSCYLQRRLACQVSLVLHFGYCHLVPRLGRTPVQGRRLP